MKPRKIAALLAALTLIGSTHVSAESAPAPASVYDGTGMCISVIGSGFFTDHECFAITNSSPKLTKETSDALIPLTSAGKDTVAGTSFYISEKIPFAYDYGDRDTDLSNSSYQNKGGAMISAAAGNGSVTGTAPEAQILAMKVFSDKAEGITQDALADAILDSVILGADVILMDISVISGLSYDENSQKVHSAIEKAEENGITVVCPAGDVSEYGKGSVFEKKYEITDMPTSVPDRGTVAWPGSAPGVLSVASADPNAIGAECFGLPDGTRIPYSDNNYNYEVTSGRGFSEYFEGLTPEYVCIDGVGKPEDLESAGDLTGKLVVVDRGTVSFSEKAKNAAAFGAIGVIVVDSQPVAVDTVRTLTDLTDAPIPLILVPASGGKILRASEDKRIEPMLGEVFPMLTRLTPAISKFSAFVTTPDLALNPDVAAVGSDFLYATADGAHGVISSTLVSAGRVAGICTCVKQKLSSEVPELNGRELADTVKALVVSSAALSSQNIDGYPYSPRAQGGGVTESSAALAADMTLTFDGLHKLELGDGLGSFIQFKVTARNLSGEEKSCVLDAVVGSDNYVTYRIDQLELDMDAEDALYKGLGYNADDEISFIKNFTPFAKSSVTLSSGGQQLNAYSEDCSPFEFTLAPGEERTFPITLYLNSDELNTYNRIFENGFFVEGFVRMNAEGKVYSAPFLGFAGEFSDASAEEGDVYSKAPSIFDKRYIYTTDKYGIKTVGDVTGPDDEDPVYDGSRLYFTGGTDRKDAMLMLNFALLRTASDVTVRVTDENGNTVSEKRLGTVARTYVNSSTGMTVSEQIPLWNGRADDNFAYIYPDGKYTVTVSYEKPGACARESFSYTVLLDRTAPVIEKAEFDLAEYTCHLKLSISDTFEIGSLTVTDSNKELAKLEEDGRYNISLLTGKYIYVDVTDRADNRRVMRLDNPVHVSFDD